MSHLEEFKAFADNFLAEGIVDYTVKGFQTPESLIIVKYSVMQYELFCIVQSAIKI